MLAAQRLNLRQNPSCFRSGNARRVCVSVRAAATARTSLQLATAKLPAGVEVPAFASTLYQWAATLTQSGANYPFVLPVQTDKLATGFKISLLKSISKGSFASAGEIEATVEEIQGEGRILFVRFFEGPASMADRRVGEASEDPEKRLEEVLQGLIDVNTIMGTMPRAIRKAVQMSTK